MGRKTGLDEKVQAVKRSKDQHWLECQEFLEKIVDTAGLEKEDTVIEIGPGKGSLTRLLARKAGRVIAVELDKGLRKFLEDLPPNVRVVYADAWDWLNKNRLPECKLVSSPPYSMSEPLFHHLCHHPGISLAVLVLPERFVRRARKNIIFKAFLEWESIAKIPRECFSPPPRTESLLVIIRRKRTLTHYNMMVKQLYLQEDKKLKNALRETIVRVFGETKKKASKIIGGLGLSEEIMKKKVEHVSLEEYDRIVRRTLELLGRAKNKTE